MAQYVGHHRADVAQYPPDKRKGEHAPKKVIHAGQGTPLDPSLQVGDMNMHVGWSQDYGSFFYTCIYGCHETDYESSHEAQQAFLSHVCRSAGEVCS